MQSGEHCNRLAFQFGRFNALRSTGETLDQLQQQLRATRQKLHAERHQHALNESRMRQENAAQARELAEAKYELARRDTRDAFAAVPSRSAAVH
jgi:septal ring factor EnvC (AmiA/AmiB activator)